MAICNSKPKTKKLSYRRETARQLPTWRGLGHLPTLPMLSLATPMHMVESETRNKLTSRVPSTKRTLRWIQHSRSSLLVPAGIHNGVLSSCAINADVISEASEDMATGKRQIRRFQRPLEDVPARNAFEYLQMIYIARN